MLEAIAVREAAVAREIEARRSAYMGLLCVLVSVALVAWFAISHRAALTNLLISVVYSAVLIPPFSWLALRHYTSICVRALSEHPKEFARLHPQRLLGFPQPPPVERLMLWVSVVFVPAYALPWVLLSLYTNASAWAAALLTGCTMGLGLTMLVDFIVWRRHGRTQIEE